MSSQHIDIIDLGRMAYAQAFALQKERNQALVDQTQPEAIYLVEHDPVITLSNRPAARDHLIASEQRLTELGIAVEPTNRGGDITYHGPGQLVAYPILRLGDHGLNLSSYMRCLEQIVIDVLASYEIHGEREPGATGVWVKQPTGVTAKICAMGVRIRKNVTMHGLALNVTTNLDHFKTIIPCGLEGRPVTNMQQQRGELCPDMGAVKDRMVAKMLDTWT